MPKNKIRSAARYFMITAVLLVAVSCLAASGSQQRADGGQKYSASLLVLRSANGQKYLTYPDGKQELTYTIDSEYPAASVLSFLAEELKKQGWKPLPNDFLNPDTPSSHVRGWTFFEVGSHEPKLTVRQWLADWENGTHDITTYALQYRYPTSGNPDSKTLHVIALYMSAETANKMRRPNDPKK
jgi:hypothetical protein